MKGFGGGFPESHAASFALLVYISAWLKRHQPAAFMRLTQFVAHGFLLTVPVGAGCPAPRH